MKMVIDPDRPVNRSLLSDKWVSSLWCSDTGVRVQVVVREQLALSVTNTRSHMMSAHSLVTLSILQLFDWSFDLK